MKPRSSFKKISSSSFTDLLIAWYRANHISYPWRQTNDIYRIWLSEILLQQTRIPVALKFYDAILAKYPTLVSLANAAEEEFLSVWSGIGYYSRARNMLRCARQIMADHNGQFPSDWDSLLALPGIGPYTAGALSNFCFGRLTPAIDGNIRRVIARITNNIILINQNNFRKSIESAFLSWGVDADPADYVQALMELGEQICLPEPACEFCPVQSQCKAYAAGTALTIPRTPPKRKSVPHFWYLLILQKGDRFYFVQNDRREFLRDSWIFPDLLSSKKLTSAEIRQQYLARNIRVNRFEQIGSVRHAVTFRKIQGIVLSSRDFQLKKQTGKWLSVEELQTHHTSSITPKVLNKFSVSLR